MSREKPPTPKVRLVVSVDAAQASRLDALQQRIRRKNQHQDRSASTISALVRLALEEYLDARRA